MSARGRAGSAAGTRPWMDHRGSRPIVDVVRRRSLTSGPGGKRRGPRSALHDKGLPPSHGLNPGGPRGPSRRLRANLGRTDRHEEESARPWSGTGRYRTDIVGWYLRRDRAIGVGEDGRYYVLVVAPERFGRWRTVHVEPTPPPLQTGRGGRDGDSVALDVLLAMRLDWTD